MLMALLTVQGFVRKCIFRSEVLLLLSAYEKKWFMVTVRVSHSLNLRKNAQYGHTVNRLPIYWLPCVLVSALNLFPLPEN